MFTMALMLQGKILMSAEGATKKEASLLAAKAVWDQCQGDTKALIHWLKSQGMSSRYRRAKTESIEEISG
jgi:hypothetical protein